MGILFLFPKKISKTKNEMKLFSKKCKTENVDLDKLTSLDPFCIHWFFTTCTKYGNL